MVSLATRRMVLGCIALAVDMRKGWPVRQPSPKKLPGSSMAMTACFPWVDRTVSFTLPLWT